MKKTVFAAAIVIAMSSIGVAHAADTSFKVGVAQYTEKYTEVVGGKTFMTEDANMTEVNGAVQVNFNSGFGLQVNGAYATGTSDYTGAYQGGNYGDLKINGQDRSRYQVEGLAIKNIDTLSQIKFQVGAGLGYRNLTDRLDQAGAGGYKRVNELQYGLVTAKAAIPAGQFAITPAITYRHVLKGTQHSYLSDAELIHNQPKGYGWEVAVGIATTVGKTTVELSPFVRQWKMEASDIVAYNGNGTYEPENDTKEVGVNLSVRF